MKAPTRIGDHWHQSGWRIASGHIIEYEVRLPGGVRATIWKADRSTRWGITIDGQRLAKRYDTSALAAAAADALLRGALRDALKMLGGRR